MGRPLSDGAHRERRQPVHGLFAVLHEGQGLNPPNADAFVDAAAAFLGELNAIHPFREGNGRSQLAFMHLIGIKAGYPFEFSRVSPEAFMPAMIASYDRNLGPLADELGALLA